MPSRTTGKHSARHSDDPVRLSRRLGGTASKGRPWGGRVGRAHCAPSRTGGRGARAAGRLLRGRGAVGGRERGSRRRYSRRRRRLAASLAESVADQASQQIDQERGTAITRATGRVAPAVVSVSVLRTQRVQPRSLWESMMLPPGASRQSAGFGSGVIVRRDGIVLTNDHVITGADRIQGDVGRRP